MVGKYSKFSTFERLCPLSGRLFLFDATRRYQEAECNVKNPAASATGCRPRLDREKPNVAGNHSPDDFLFHELFLKSLAITRKNHEFWLTRPRTISAAVSVQINNSW